VKPIGRVESPLTDLASAPRQADEGAPEVWLVFGPEALEGLLSLRPGDEVKALAVTSGDHHLPMTGHNRQELARVFAPRRPHALDEWRIRRAIFKRQEHG
jgi:hypothetical protein